MSHSSTALYEQSKVFFEYQTVILDIGKLIGQLAQVYSNQYAKIIPTELLQYSHGLDLGAKVLVNQSMPPNKLIELQTSLYWALTAIYSEYISSCTYAKHSHSDTIESEFKQFVHPHWDEHAYFVLIKKLYALLHKHMLACVHALEGLDHKTKEQLKFHLKTFLTYVAPTNSLWTNPEVLAVIAENGGINLLHGIKNYLADLVANNGQLNIRMTDLKAFTLGENIACTPGKVIFQNDLMQLIQYAPTTDQVSKTPILIVPPYINKYYVLDLSPHNSLVKWLVDQGNTVYMISWVNPGVELANKTFDDYMLEGPIQAINVITSNPDSKSVHMVGYCIGGTLLSCALAYMKHNNDLRAKSATFFMSLLDFSDPGEIGIFIDEQQLDGLEKIMQSHGYLNGHLIDMTFNLLRPNDVIWPYFINNYLLGKQTKPFDIFYWNADSTNQAYKMYIFYLRNMYLKNLLRKPGGITLAGVPINLAQINTPAFFVGAEADHITTWKSVYSGLKYLGGAAEFLLTESGHVRGMVNPPGKTKYGFKVNKKYRKHDDFQQSEHNWLENSTKIEGSWWPYWLEWLNSHDSTKVPARKINESTVIESAPGSYVLKRI